LPVLPWTPNRWNALPSLWGAEIADDERQSLQPLETEPLPDTLYLGIDGTGVPMRASELTGRGGKQPDGSATTREVKLCTVWSAETRDEAGRPVRDQGSVTYTAAIESAPRWIQMKSHQHSSNGCCGRLLVVALPGLAVP
jgi:hypothetical protein